MTRADELGIDWAIVNSFEYIPLIDGSTKIITIFQDETKNFGRIA